MRQRGQALLGLLVLLGIAGSVFVYNLIDPAEASARRQARIETTLREARDALIGRAASDANRPGSLPCPDVDDDGVLTLNVDFFSGGVCANLIGRLPWRTLGLPDLRDSSGERLWYALSDRFSDNSGVGPINSDIKGNVTVYHDPPPAPFVTNEAVAIIFSPGAALGTQDRSCTVGVNCTANGQCTTSPASLTPKCNPANYLDTVAPVNNATTGGPFIGAPPSGTFNDRLLVITTADLMPVVEQRVAREVLASLETYRNLIGAYPWADCSDGSSDVPPDYVNRGRIPFVTTLPADWSSPPTPPFLPAWFGPNYWNWVIYYAAGKIYLQGGGASCTTCQDPELTLTGVGTKRVAIIMTGPSSVSPPPGPPGSSNICSKSDWQAYLEDPENVKDKDNPLSSDDTFKRPSSTAYVRDRLYTCPGTPGIC